MIDWRMSLAVLAGGGIGALCRYIIGAAFVQRLGPGFPYGTLVINLLGCFLIGILAQLAITRSIAVTPIVRAFLVVGVLGGFTTFSSFAYETVTLLDEAAALPALLYVCGSVLGGILAAFAGIAIVRSVS